MLGRDDALQLLAFDRWANTSIANAVEGIAQAEKLLAHILGAAELWQARVSGGDYKKLAVWPGGLTLAQVRARLEAVGERWRAHVQRADAAELARVVQFTNSAGKACSDRVDDIVLQLVHHGTHHRGQIASLVRAAGRTPQTLDYIVWRRGQAARKHFVIESTYVGEIARIDAQLAAHRAHLETGFQTGMLLASGPQQPRTGGIILARARDKAEVEAFLACDPFAQAGIARYRVLEYEPVKQAPLFSDWARGV